MECIVICICISKRKLEGHSVERMYLRQRCSPRLAVKKTILKPRLAAATGAQYLYMGFSHHNKIPCCCTYNIGESNPVPGSGYNPDRAQKLISSSMSRHLLTRNISSKSMHTLLSNLANRQTDRQTHLRPLSEVENVFKKRLKLFVLMWGPTLSPGERVPDCPVSQ